MLSMLSITAFAAASRSALPVLMSFRASSAVLAVLLKRVSARSRSSFDILCDFLFLRVGLGGCGLVAVGRLLGQSDRAKVRRPLAYRNVSGCDIRHRLDAFGLLRELPVQPDL